MRRQPATRVALQNARGVLRAARFATRGDSRAARQLSMPRPHWEGPPCRHANVVRPRNPVRSAGTGGRRMAPPRTRPPVGTSNPIPCRRGSPPRWRRSRLRPEMGPAGRSWRPWPRRRAASPRWPTPINRPSTKPLPPSVVALVGERAARFHQEWLADWPELLLDVLEQVVAIDASADWAQKRLIVALTLAERWDRLLGVYDRALSVVPERGRRVQLLKEAVQVAKDFVGDADRAIGYLQLLAALEPGDWQVTNALERLLERQGRWAELVTSWRTRLESADGDEARALRVRIAEVQIDKLGMPAPALEEARLLLAEEAGREGLALGERLIALESAPRGGATGGDAAGGGAPRSGRQTGAGAGGGAGRPGLRDRLGARRASSRCRSTADRSGRRPRGRRSPGRLARALPARRRGAGLLAPAVRGHRRRRAVCTRSGGGRRPHLGSAATGGALVGRRRRARALARRRHRGDRLLPARARCEGGGAGRLPARAAQARRAAGGAGLSGRAGGGARGADSAPHPSVRAAGCLGRAGAVRGGAAATSIGRRRRGSAASKRSRKQGRKGQRTIAKLWTGFARCCSRRSGGGRWWRRCGDAWPRPPAFISGGPTWNRLLGWKPARLETPPRPSRPGASTNGPSGPRPPARKRSPNCWRRARAGTTSARCCPRWRAEIGSRRRPSACASAILCRGHLGALEGAATWYRWALQANPQAAGARAGLWALLDRAAPRAVHVTATAALAAAAAETDDWALTLRLLEPRLALTGESAEKAELLREAARLAESRAND